MASNCIAERQKFSLENSGRSPAPQLETFYAGLDSRISVCFLKVSIISFKGLHLFESYTQTALEMDMKDFRKSETSRYQNVINTSFAHLQKLH